MPHFDPEFVSRINNSKLAGWWNVTLCTCLIIGALYMGITQSPFGFAVAAVGAAMDVVFVRKLIQSYRTS